MFRKSFILILIGIFAGATFAQVSRPRPESRGFSMFFDDVGYLGIETEEVTKENFGKYGLSEVRGVRVEKVMNGSPAQTAGLQNGDVIVKFNGEAVTSTRKLTRMIGEIAPDHQVRLTVSRGGEEREITVTAGKRPTPKFEEGSFAYGFPGRTGRMRIPPMGEMPNVQVFPRTPGAHAESFVWQSGSSRRIGVSVNTLTKQLSENFGVSGGVMINTVREDSPAAKAGLKTGDIIVEADGKEIKSEPDLIRAISEKKEGDVTLTIVRDRNRQTVRVTPEASKSNFNMLYDFPDGPYAPEGMNFVRPVRLGMPTIPVPLSLPSIPCRIF